MRVRPQRRLSTEELMLSNCGVGEDLRVSWTARRSIQSIVRKLTLNIHWKDCCEAKAEAPVLWPPDAKS